ncbi:deoxyribose-phosphate aldolase [Strigomonas culicis]|uniref:deoxyribose-phosphate aldolase n=1 Tax=Strigomonas culicis TaxID=28005 RepID=S9W4R2_9TRYP|nr:deoxyribose-phosphate aldolase [Strigomonas culicis]|eukprot:EPY30870.1 deoxyribose-phosphate aldolase [Strigomonas culicis]
MSASLPGAEGKLNEQIRERIAFLSRELALPHLADGFPHLREWRPRVPQAVSEETIAAHVDHTLLKSTATAAAVTRLCEEARTYQFCTVCVHDCFVPLCRALLEGSAVRVACVCNFPLGHSSPRVKAMEAAENIANGAQEIDTVMNVGLLRDRQYKKAYDDFFHIAQVCRERGVTLKIILETCLLSTEEIIDACIIGVANRVDFVKTSTGFSTAGATPEAVDVMLAVVGDACAVKVSGGVRDRPTALQYLRAGAQRIGTSSGTQICPL